MSRREANEDEGLCADEGAAQTDLWHAVPRALPERVAWCCWRKEMRGGKATKVPYIPQAGPRQHAKCDDPATWRTFEEALAHVARFDGIGIMLGDGLAGVDLDDCMDSSGVLKPWAAAMVKELDSYTEVSPSGRGVKIFAYGAIPPGRKRKKVADGQVEMYSERRFFTVTGRHLPGTPITVEKRQAQIEALHARVFSGSGDGPAPAPTAAPAKGCGLSDEELLGRARAASSGDKFAALWEGDTSGYPSTSEADLALCSMLVSLCGQDPARVERLFLKSGLGQREKARRPDYVERTVTKALAGRTEFYTAGGGGRRGGGDSAALQAAEALVLQVETNPDPTLVWKGVDVLASLRPGQLTAVRQRLKQALGDRLNLNDLAAAIRECRSAKREEARAAAGKPVVRLGSQLDGTTQAALSVLLQANIPPVFFVRSGDLVRLRSDEHGAQFIGDVGVDEMRERLATCAVFVRPTERGERDVDPPEVLCRNLLAAPSFSAFPPLVGVSESPLVRPDGSILTTSGYDPDTHMIYAPHPSLALPPIPEHPNCGDRAQALALLLEAIEGFPFVDQASRANALAMILTPLLRPAITGPVPAGICDAPQAGVGKSLLAELVAVIATGRPAALFAGPEDDAEWRKRLTAALVCGPALIVVDNVEGRLEAPSLAAALTARMWQDRILGRTENVRLPQRSTFLVTGNNVSLAGDLPRRCYHCRLDPKVARPWERSGFRHQGLTSWAESNRGALLAAALTLIRAWFADGRPKAEVRVLGSFEAWTTSVGGVLALADVPGFLQNLPELWERSDQEAAEWVSFLTTLQDAFGTEGVTVGEILGAAADSRLQRCDFPSRAVDRSGVPEGRRLGRALASVEGRRFPLAREEGVQTIRVVRGEDRRLKQLVWSVVVE